MTDSSENSIQSNVGINPVVYPGMAKMLLTDSLDVFKAEPKPNNRPFECTICGNRFRQQCHLTQHIRIHTNDRPYQCSHCDKAFKQKSQLNQHERIHTGEKPYQCPLCAKAFPQAGQLYSHKKTHGINPRVTKDPPEGIDVPRRGRKRKVKNTLVMSTPHVPVTYFIENLHRPPLYQNVHMSDEHAKRNVFNKSHTVSATETVTSLKSTEKHLQQAVPTSVKEPLSPNIILGDRHRVIPISRAHYQYFFQNHAYHHQQNQYMPPPEDSKLPSFSRTVAELPSSRTNSKKNDASSEVETSTSKTHISLDSIPPHLKDLERLIPTCDQT